jgi:hypothetical protein
MEEKTERPVMTEEEFKDYIGYGTIKFFDGVGRFRSIKRAIKHGKASPLGEVYPDRPFNNRKPTKGRAMNEKKKDVYAKLKQLGHIQ